MHRPRQGNDYSNLRCLVCVDACVEVRNRCCDAVLYGVFWAEDACAVIQEKIGVVPPHWARLLTVLKRLGWACCSPRFGFRSPPKSRVSLFRSFLPPFFLRSSVSCGFPPLDLMNPPPLSLPLYFERMFWLPSVTSSSCSTLVCYISVFLPPSNPPDGVMESCLELKTFVVRYTF